MILDYLDFKGMSRGFMNKSPSACINDFQDQLQTLLNLFTSLRALTQKLSKTGGLDLKLLQLLFVKTTSKDYNGRQILQIIEDPNFADNFRFRKELTKGEIIMRVISGFDVPEDIFRNLIQIVSVNGMRFSEGNIQYRSNKSYDFGKELNAKFGTKEAFRENLGELDLDIDFLKRLVYFSKNLEETMTQRGSHKLENLKMALSFYQSSIKVTLKKKEMATKDMPYINPLAGPLRSLSEREYMYGGFNNISVKQRFESEHISRQEEVYEFVKDTLLFDKSLL